MYRKSKIKSVNDKLSNGRSETGIIIKELQVILRIKPKTLETGILIKGNIAV